MTCRLSLAAAGNRSRWACAEVHPSQTLSASSSFGLSIDISDPMTALVDRPNFHRDDGTTGR